MNFKLLTKRYIAIMIDILLIFFIIIIIELFFLDRPDYTIMNEVERSEYISNKTYRFIFYNFLLIFKDLKFLSIGKKMLGLKIISDNLSIEHPKFYQLILRNLTMAVGLGFFETFVVISNNKNKRIGDFMAKTLVVKDE